MMLMMIETLSDNIFIIGLLYGHRPKDTFAWGPRDDEVILRLLETATSFLLTWLRDRKSALTNYPHSRVILIEKGLKF